MSDRDPYSEDHDLSDAWLSFVLVIAVVLGFIIGYFVGDL